MKTIFAVLMVGHLCQLCADVLGATLAEDFSTDPAINSRFELGTLGTESSFIFDPTNKNLLAVLDVDRDAAWYLSTPFSALTEASNISFSFEFKVITINTELTLPSAFVGLMTTTPITVNGDGLSLVLSVQANRPAAVVEVDQGPRNSGGQSIQLETNVTYLAIGRYTATDRQFTVGIYTGTNFTNLFGTSTTYATNGGGFNVDRMGLQNKGGEVNDYTNGSITLRVDNFFMPARPSVFIAVTNTGVRELDAGATSAVFTVSLSSTSSHPVQLDFATTDMTATAGQDYEATSGTLLFPPGTSRLTVSVPVFGDTLAEPDEAFALILSNPVNAILSDTRSTAIITNDDLSIVSIGDATVTEVPGGTTQAVFAVSLSKSNSQPVSISYVTVNETAAAPGDYVPTSGVLVLPPGVTSDTIRVTVNGDTIDENNETFWVSLYSTSPTNAVLGDAMGLGTIISTNPLPSVGFCSTSYGQTTRTSESARIYDESEKLPLVVVRWFNLSR